MGRLSQIYTQKAADAPDDFKERLEFWRTTCALGESLHERLQRLRVWRNAAEHGDDERWYREGPRDEVELLQLLRTCDAMVEKLEVRARVEERPA